MIIIRRGGVSDIISVGPALHPYEYPYREAHDGRPHIVHMKTLEHKWVECASGKARYSIKELSVDSDSGDRTYLLSLPPGWEGQLQAESGRSFEAVLIEGKAFLDDGSILGPLFYLHRPPGCRDAPISASPNGCVLMVWESVSP